MKLLHIADLHIGKRLHGYSLWEDQAAMLRSLADLARAERCDAALVAGDLYDRQQPSAESVRMADDFLCALSDAVGQVFVVAGNHDSAERVAYASRLLAPRGVHMARAFTGEVERFSLTDECGDVDIFLLPYLRPALARACYPGEAIDSYEDAVRRALRDAAPDPARRSVLVGHQFVAGGMSCESEELSIGGQDAVPASLFDGYDYVALGHLHRAQSVGRETLRYAGSPLKYSRSEARGVKSAALVTLGRKGDVRVETPALTPLHDVREVRGTPDELLALPESDDYLYATVLGADIPTDLDDSLRARLPNLLECARQGGAADAYFQAEYTLAGRTPTELFEALYARQHGGQAMDERRRALLRRVMEEADA